MISAPNESIITGTILKVDETSDGLGQIYKIKIENAESVKDLPDFAKSYIGKSIVVFAQLDSDVKEKLSESKRIQAHINYQGDERGGDFFMIENKISLVPIVK